MLDQGIGYLIAQQLAEQKTTASTGEIIAAILLSLSAICLLGGILHLLAH